MKRLALALLCMLFAFPAWGQNNVKQSGRVTPNHPTMWVTDGVIGDAGTAVKGFLTGVGVIANGPGICQASGPQTGPYNQLCITLTGTGGGFTFNSFGGATGVPNFVINGVTYPFPFSAPGGIVGPGSTTTGDFACWANTVGTLLSDCLITVGTPITGGTNGSLLFDNNHLIGEETLASLLVSPPPIGSTTPSTGKFTTLQATSTFTGQDNGTWTNTGISGTAIATSPINSSSVGAATPSTGAFTTLSASSTVSGAGFSTYLASPPAIGSGAPNTGAFTTLTLSSPATVPNGGTGNTTATAHSLPVNEGASAQASTSAGTAGQCVVSGGASADPSFQSGCTVLLNTLTASNSTNLQDTTSLIATYSSYEIVFINVVPASNAVSFEMQVQVSATFQTTGYLGSAFITNSSGGGNSSAVATTFIPLTPGAVLFNGAPGYNGKLTINNPSAATITPVNGSMTYATSASVAHQGTFGGYYNTSGAVTGVQFLMSTGNITSGTIKIYGRI